MKTYVGQSTTNYLKIRTMEWRKLAEPFLWSMVLTLAFERYDEKQKHLYKMKRKQMQTMKFKLIHQKRGALGVEVTWTNIHSLTKKKSSIAVKDYINEQPTEPIKEIRYITGIYRLQQFICKRLCYYSAHLNKKNYHPSWSRYANKNTSHETLFFDNTAALW